MRIFKVIGTKLLAIALAFAVLPAAVPSNVPVVGVSQAQAQPYHHGGERRFYRHGGGHYGGGYHGGGYYGGRHDYGRNRFYGHNRFYGNNPYYGRDRYYGHNRYYGRHYNGSGIAAGAILGFGLGTAIGVYPGYHGGHRYYRSYPGHYGYRSRERYESCAARYRSFDPRTGTYQPNHGPRRVCR